jgi:hypothetical protein
MRRISAFLLGIPLLLTGALATAAPASAVIGGTTSAYGPWAVRMLLDGNPWCTGTAISPEWVISASHCFFDLPDAPFADSRLTFRVGSLDQRKGRLVHVVAGSRRGNPQADITMIKVQPMGIPVAKLPTGPVRVGQAVRQYGWGATCTTDENSCQSDVLRQSVLRVASPADPRCDGFISPDGTDFCMEKISGVPAGGDSGGPVMTAAAPGTEVLVGVLDGSDRESVANAGQVSAQLAWIHTILGK